ncbi:MAG: heavy-metal-associated domain-containing protein, partial [Candidatus Bathyarchaeota archaeon]
MFSTPRDISSEEIFICFFHGETGRRGDNTQMSKSKKSRKTVLNIDRMTCASCALTIEKTLKEHAGVEKANVNFASEKAHITYDPKVTNKKELIETVRATGYDAHLRTKKT